MSRAPVQCVSVSDVQEAESGHRKSRGQETNFRECLTHADERRRREVHRSPDAIGDKSSDAQRQRHGIRPIERLEPNDERTTSLRR